MLKQIKDFNKIFKEAKLKKIYLISTLLLQFLFLILFIINFIVLIILVVDYNKLKAIVLNSGIKRKVEDSDARLHFL